MDDDASMLDPRIQESLRLRVAVAVVGGGMKQVKAVETFHVDSTWVHNWVKAYRKGGAKALHAKPRGRPKRSRPAGHQAAAVVHRITDRTPDQLKRKMG